MRAAVSGSNARFRWTVSPHVVIAGGVFLTALLFRLSTVSLTNDDYLHLSLAQQVLLGDVPVRDFIDPGEFLYYHLSAAVQALLGRHLLSEVMLDALSLAVGYTFIFLLASHASRSCGVGIFVTTIAVLLMPHLYSYPKILLYGVAVAVMWRYIERRRTRDLIILAVWTAVAFLFRHDHGVYIGAASSVMLLLTYWGQGWRAAGRKVLAFGATAALLLLPFFIFLQVNGGVIPYWRISVATGRVEHERTVGSYPPLFVSPPAIDTDSAGRSTVTPHVIEPNFSAWFYYLTVILPPLALITLVKKAPDTSPPTLAYEREKIASAAVLAALMQPFLLRAASQSAVADVSVLTAVLGAWLMRRGLLPWPGVAAWPLARAVLTLAVLAGSLAAARRTEGAHALQELVATLEDEGIDPIGKRLNGLRQSSAPFPSEGARYVFACTEERDRLLISGYAPDLHYKTGRGFAAGRPYFLGTLALPEHERFSIERLKQQRVPIVLATDDDDRGFASFPLVREYVRRYYREAGEVQFSDDTTYAVLVDVRIPPACSYGTERLPCFRPCPGTVPSAETSGVSR